MVCIRLFLSLTQPDEDEMEYPEEELRLLEEQIDDSSYKIGLLPNHQS